MLHPIIDIGDKTGPGMLSGLASIALIGRGRYAVSSNTGGSEHEIMVFDSTGKYLTTVGRKGSGPGEFQFIRWLRALGDQLFVFDAQMRRISVFNSELKFVRSYPFQGRPLGDALPLSDSLVLVNAAQSTRQSAGLLLHLVRPAGETTKSFLEPPGGFRFDINELVYFRTLTRSSSNRFWAAHFTDYRLDQMDYEGVVTQSFVRNVDWFPAHLANTGAYDPSRPPLPTIRSTYEDPAGRLWVLILVADRNWASSLVPADRQGQESRYLLGDGNRAFDTVIDVIDVKTGTLLASTRIDEALAAIIGPGYGISYRKDEDGIPTIKSWKLVLENPPRR